MIGYLRPVRLTCEERAVMRRTQCGLCGVLGREYGLVYRLAAGPDLVFFNVLMDLLGEDAPAEQPVTCPLRLGLGRVPGRIPDGRSRLAAAVGVYMSVAKLRDDLDDDGGWWRRMAWRLARPAQDKARRILDELGLDASRVDEQMAEQARIEQIERLDLGAAVGPTRAIARQVFSAAGTDPSGRRLATDLGDALGSFLFYADNLLDFHRDLASGGYNALARAHGWTHDPERMPARVRAAGLGGARASAERLSALAELLPDTRRGRYVRKVVIGLWSKLGRIQRSGPAELRGLTLRRLHSRWRLPGMPLRLRVALAMGAAWILPRTSAAGAWWDPRSWLSFGGGHSWLSGDTGADTGLSDTGGAGPGGGDGGVGDTGVADTALSDTGAPDSAGGETSLVDTSGADTSSPDTSSPDTTSPDTSVFDASDGDTASGGTSTGDSGTSHLDTAGTGEMGGGDTSWGDTGGDTSEFWDSGWDDGGGPDPGDNWQDTGWGDDGLYEGGGDCGGGGSGCEGVDCGGPVCDSPDCDLGCDGCCFGCC